MGKKKKRLLLSEFQPHCEPLGESQMQRGDPAQRWASGWDCPGMLQLWLSQCLSPGLHPSQGWLCGGATLQVGADDILSYRGSAIPLDTVFSVLCGVSVGTVWKLDLLTDYKVVWDTTESYTGCRKPWGCVCLSGFSLYFRWVGHIFKVQKLDVELPELGR